jgi:long-subunit fatty acid transport protein
MGRIVALSALFGSASSLALAGGLDRTGQPIDILFEEGNYAELSFARTMPQISGEGVGIAPIPGIFPGFPAGTGYEGVGLDFNTFSASVKFDITEELSAAFRFSQPFGSDIEYDGDPFRTELGGTSAIADSNMITALLRYKFTDNWSVHGGLRIDRASGEIDLGGLAYGAVSGYTVELEERTDVGWVAGVAYEVPEIALRVALTYNSAITHDFDTTESGPLVDPDGPGPLPPLPLLDGTSTTEVELPRSVNIDFQTGIAADTLIFGSFRWAEWSEFRIDPENFEAVTGGGLVDLQDSRTWTFGVGRRFTERFAGQASVSYEATDSDDLVSPLAPTNGFFAVGLGGAYDVSENVVLSAGARYTWFGNARPETGTPDVARASFEDNTALTVGVNVGFRF